MKVPVTYYGLIADCIGKSNELVEISHKDGKFDLRPFFEHRYPELIHSNYKIAVNQTITETFNESDDIREIALLPPFAGG